MLNVHFSKSTLVVFSISWQDHNHTLPYSNWHFFFFLINFIGVFVVIVQLLSCIQLFAPPGTAARQTFLSFITFWSLLKLLSIESVMLSNHLILCCPLLLLLSIFPSIRVFSNESVLCITWPKYWSLCISISPSTEYLGLISFRMDCFYFLAVQGILKSLLLHHNSKASILQSSAL